LSIRGITTGGPFFTTPTVGITVDDVPFGGTSQVQVPDFDPGDLARIEVLRGPQGTLYGVSSMGGLLKYVTIDPSTDSFRGRVETGVSTVYNGYSLGENIRASVNVPISDTLAVRASAFTRQDPGYIDNPVLGIRGINEAHVSGGRLALLWKPTDTLSLKLNALEQRSESGGSNDIDVAPGLGDLQQNYIRGVGPHGKTLELFSAVLKEKIGIVDVTSITGYNSQSGHDSFDDTAAFGSLTLPLFGVTGSPSYDHGVTHKLSQEIRFAAPIGTRIDALLGGYYTHEVSGGGQQFFATDPFTGKVHGQTVLLLSESNFIERAAFADLTFHATDRISIEVGGRYSRSGSGLGSSFLVAPIFGIPPGSSPSDPNPSPAAVTYLLTPQFKLNSDVMIYARIASGFRPGGLNPPSPDTHIPGQFQPDKTKNYEIGTKGDFLDHKFSIDASVYYINWVGIQLGLNDPVSTISFTANAGRAKSQGVELSVIARPVDGLTVSTWVVFSDAVLKQGFPPGATLNGNGVYGVDGDPLPYSSRFSANASADQNFRITGDVTGFVGASMSYIGEREDVFTSTAQRQFLPAFAKTDGRLGAKYESWTGTFYVNNLTNRRGIMTGGLGNPIPYSFYVITPRTIGLSVAKTF
jgi:outer membrane receptor protein involved in Fe transport